MSSATNSSSLVDRIAICLQLGKLRDSTVWEIRLQAKGYMKCPEILTSTVNRRSTLKGTPKHYKKQNVHNGLAG